MDWDTILGIIILILGLGLLTYLVIWSRNTINSIANKKLNSIREIIRELHNGR